MRNGDFIEEEILLRRNGQEREIAFPLLFERHHQCESLTTIFVPLSAQQLAAANVRDGKDEPAIQQADQVAPKHRVLSGSIRSIALQQTWVLAVWRDPLAENKRDRNLRPVSRRSC